MKEVALPDGYISMPDALQILHGHICIVDSPLALNAEMELAEALNDGSLKAFGWDPKTDAIIQLSAINWKSLESKSYLTEKVLHSFDQEEISTLVLLVSKLEFVAKFPLAQMIMSSIPEFRSIEWKYEFNSLAYKSNSDCSKEKKSKTNYLKCECDIFWYEAFRLAIKSESIILNDWDIYTQSIHNSMVTICKKSYPDCCINERIESLSEYLKNN